MKRQSRILHSVVAAAGLLGFLAVAPTSGASPHAGTGARPQQAAVVCPPNPRMGIACELKGDNVTLSANGRVLRLHIPRRYVAMQVTCRKDARQLVTCTLRRITIGSGSGTRIVAVTVPAAWRTLQISCASAPSARGVACRVTHRVGVTTVGG